MARPKKNADEKFSEFHQLAMRPHTSEMLTSKSSAYGLGKSEFLRNLIEETPLPASRSTSDPAKIAALNNYVVALSRGLNNVNQLAASVHQGRDFVKYWREIGAELEQDRAAARQALEDALKDLG